MSKTPQFDAALETILASLKPRERSCGKCSISFLIRAEDINFYRMLRVPPPTLCPLCRKKRRLAHLLRLPKFFRKECQAPEHNEEVITVFPQESPHKVYDFAYWHSDAWDPTQFGLNYNPNQLFFPQFQKLFFSIPHPPLERDPRGIGVGYSLGGLGGNNNYFCAMAYETENAAYCLDVRFSRDIFDCNLVARSELCFESVAADSCSRCLYIVGCSQCLDSVFLYDCKNCNHCFMSSNLRNRSYVFKNKQLTKENYEREIKKLPLQKRSFLQKQKTEFSDLLRRSIHRALQTHHTRESVGDSLSECRDCFWVFRSEKSENVRYSDNVIQTRDSMDVLNCKGELNYEGVVNAGHNLRFSMNVRDSSFLEYSAEMYNCHNCFASVGLKNKKFHIFNQPYEEKEYWQKVDETKTSALSKGEYGEFFPLTLGLTPYQTSFAMKNFPVTENTARKSGIPWYNEPETKIPENIIPVKAADIPDDIRDIDETILEKAVLCEKTDKPFRITEQELTFYKKMNLPLPVTHPYERIMSRVKLEHPVELFPFICPKCQKKSYSVFNETKQKELTIYCENCYLREVV